MLTPLYREQVAALAPLVDLFICETMSHSTEALAAAEAATESGKPVFVAFTLDDDREACSKSGEPLASVCKLRRAFRPEGILANCCLPEQINAMPTSSRNGWTSGQIWQAAAAALRPNTSMKFESGWPCAKNCHPSFRERLNRAQQSFSNSASSRTT